MFVNSRWFCCYSFIVFLAPIVCGAFVFGPCFVMQYPVSFLDLQYTLLRKRWLFALLWVCTCCRAVVGFASLPRGRVGWSVVCDSDIS